MLCQVRRCGRQVHCRAMCRKHYYHWLYQNSEAYREFIKAKRKKEYRRNVTVEKQKALERYYGDSPEHHLANKEKQVARQTVVRLRLVIALGGKCCNPKCLVKGGCRDIRCLQIDHKKGKGMEDLRRFKSHWKMYRYYLMHLDEAKQKIQVLCANCNWIKRVVQQQYSFQNQFTKLKMEVVVTR